MALIFAAMMEEHFTGIHIHEVVGVAIAVAFLDFHIALHLDWVVSITRTFFVSIHETRLNYVLNLALFIDMVVVIVTGILISRTLGLSLGVSADAQFPIQLIHTGASQISLIIVAFHVALHWKWILTNIQKYMPHLPRTSASRTSRPDGCRSLRSLMMKRKRKLLSARAIVAFVAFVTVSGSALAATGHFDNPVIALKDTVAMNALVDGSFALPAVSSDSQTLKLTSLDSTTTDSSVAALPALSTLPTDSTSTSTSTDTSMSLPPLSALPTDSTSTSTSADTSMSLPPLQDAGAANAAPDVGIRWSEIGDVLFDLWFLAAVTAFVIVFQHVVGFARARLSRTA